MKKFIIAVITVSLALLFGFLFAVSLKQVGNTQGPGRGSLSRRVAPPPIAFGGMPAAMSAPQFSRPPEEATPPGMPVIRTQTSMPIMPMIGEDIIYQPVINEALQDLEIKSLLLKEARRQNLIELQNIKDAMRQIEENILLTELLKREIIEQIKITDEDLQGYYEKHKEEFKIPGLEGFDNMKELVRLRLTEQLQKERLNQLIKRLRQEPQESTTIDK